MPTLTVSLPDWLTQDGPGRYTVDPAKAYPAVLAGLARWLDAEVVRRAKPVKGKPSPFAAPADLDPKAPTQFWLEVAYLLVREMVTRIVPGHVSRLRFARREDWALLTRPPQDAHVIVGADTDAALAKVQRDVSSHAARKAIGHYLPAVPALMRG